MSRRLLAAIFLLALSASPILAFAAPELSAEERAALQAQYDALQQEIAAQQQIIAETQEKKKSLQGDVTVLNAQITAAQAQIAAKNIAIKQLASQIDRKNALIGQLSARIERGKESLAAILRQEQIADDTSLVELALSGKDFSTLYANVDAFFSIKTRLNDLFSDIRAAKVQTEAEKADLAAKQDATEDARQEIESHKQAITSNKQEKQQLLAITTNQETAYQKILAERKAKAASIKAALFPLRDAASINFAEALNYAKKAQAQTGIRPAFILAVLTQESNLGSNVGQCYLTDTTTGAGVRRTSGAAVKNVMKPGRDVGPFITLGSQLGFDPFKQVVSCPQESGYGGAMGPAQFIPSTWAMYSAKVAAITGSGVPNPWAADDAIAAMSVYFDDLGAGKGTYTSEHTAAAKYFAGGAWRSRQGQTYANSVMRLASSIQKNIDFLADN